MKLIAFFVFVVCMHVQAAGYGQGITLSEKDVPLDKVFREIRKQSGYQFFYSDAALASARRVSIEVSGASIEEVLKKCFKDQPLEYTIKDRTIVVRRKVAPVSSGVEASPPIDVRGKVVDNDGKPVVATVMVKGSNNATTTDEQGFFTLSQVNDNAILQISGVSIETFEVAVKGRTDLAVVKAQVKVDQMANVEVAVNTGYQQLPKERATGSFVKVDNSLFSRKVSTDILSRIDGIVPGVLFDKRPSLNGVSQTKIQIRGLYTLTEANNVNQPLIVLDNFPYEGNLLDINPNDIESLTILRDAAAASIWGARAGNGVIVITTKRGRFNQPFKLSVASNLTVSPRPNIKKLQWIPSGDFVDLETQLFNNGFYDGDISGERVPLTPVVDILMKRRDNLITDDEATAQLNKLKNIDNRDEILNNYYRTQVNQQHVVNITGGSDAVNYYFSVGYDKNLQSLDRNQYERLSVRSVNTFKPLKNLEAAITLGYTAAKDVNNNIGWNHLNINNRLLPPYVRLTDEQGNYNTLNFYRNSYLDTVGGGNLLDWQNRPLQELHARDIKLSTDAVLAALRVRYNFTKGLAFEANYQYQNTSGQEKNNLNTETFYTRDLINQFTNLNALDQSRRYPVPMGGIMDMSNNKELSHNVRGQITFNHAWQNNQFNIFTGAELRQITKNGAAHRTYGYDDQLGVVSVDYVNPYPTIFGWDANIPSRDNYYGFKNRFVSYFTNAQLFLQNKYIISASIRRDASNIFGVKANDKGRPFWSAGGVWVLSRESFYKSTFLPNLRVKATYGYSGNIDPSVTALTIVGYQPANYNWLTNIPYATLLTLPNPELRWEKVGQFNAGVEFSFKDNRITGSIEYYKKNSKDVIYDKANDPTTGIESVRSNSARMTGQGIDAGLNILVAQAGDFKMETNLNFSYTTYKVNKLSLPQTNNYFVGNGSLLIPREGYNPYLVASYKWAGLDPSTGDPIGYANGKKTLNYDSIVYYPTSDDIVIKGGNLPKYFGNILNNLRWKQWQLSANVTYRLDYYFIRPSLNYSSLFYQYQVHSEYLNRWKNPGDELITNVPSISFANNSNREAFYNLSEIKVEKGDHIRLEDIRLSYSFNNARRSKFPIKSVDVFVIASNLNLLIWKANEAGLDPIFPAGLRTPVSITGGMKIDF